MMLFRPLKRAPGDGIAQIPQSDDWGYRMSPAEAGCKSRRESVVRSTVRVQIVHQCLDALEALALSRFPLGNGLAVNRSLQLDSV
jgi:hypothetical protein